MTRRMMGAVAVTARLRAWKWLCPTICAGALVLAGGCGSVTAHPDAQAAGPDATSGAPDAGPDASAGPGFTLSTASNVDLRVPNVIPVTVTVHRSGGFTGNVVVQATGLPPGATANPITITSANTQGMLQIATKDATPTDTATATLDGTSGSLMNTTSFHVLVLGAAGTRDVTFGTSGTTTLPSIESTMFWPSVMVLPDQSIVVTGAAFDSSGNGTLVAAHLHADGTLDTSFGTSGNGIATVDATSLNLTGVGGGWGALQSDGKIIIVGSADSTSSGNPDTIVIARLTDTGRVDLLTSENASALSASNVEVTGVAVDSSDHIVVSGDEGSGTSSATSSMVARFGPNGVLDTSFNSAGFVTSSVNSYANTVAVDDSSGRVIAGANNFASGPFDLLAYTDTGPASFGSSGVQSISYDPLAIAPLASGALLVAGKGGTVHRVAADGTSSGGTVIPGAVSLADIVVTPAGHAITCGSGQNSSGKNVILLARIKDPTSGALDPNFGTSGVAIDSSALGVAEALALRTTFRLVVLGSQSGSHQVYQYWY